MIVCVCVCVCVCKGEIKQLTAVLLLSDSADNITGVHEAQELRTHKQTREVRLRRAGSMQLINSWVFALMDKKIIRNIWKRASYGGVTALIFF